MPARFDPAGHGPCGQIDADRGRLRQRPATNRHLALHDTSGTTPFTTGPFSQGSMNQIVHGVLNESGAPVPQMIESLDHSSTGQDDRYLLDLRPPHCSQNN